MSKTNFGRIFLRETGMGLAMLAIWLLSLLAPLHQTSGLLRDMALAGHDISDAWSICITLSQDEDGESRVTSVCPAHAIGKTGVATPPPPVLLAGALPTLRGADLPTEVVRADRPHDCAPGQPRAPPATI